MKRVLLAIGVIIVLVVVGLVLAGQNNSSPSTGASNSPAASAVSEASITYDSSGFHPAETTVKSGAQITFVNRTSGNIQVDSNPHPIHTDDTDLNVGTIEPGQSKTVTLTKKGSFGFHNHLLPSDSAKITIE